MFRCDPSIPIPGRLFRELTLVLMLSLLSRLLQNDQGQRLTVCSELA